MTNREFCIAVAQSSSVKGDIAENVRRHAKFVSCAAEHGAHVVVFPELSLTGYEPTVAGETAIDSDDPQLDPLRELSDRLKVTIIAGCPIRSEKSKPYIGAFVIRPDMPVEIYRKRFLDGDEVPYFISSNDVIVCNCRETSVGIAICADISHPVHPAEAAETGATVYAAGVAITPKGIGTAEANMARYARDHNLLTAMANYATDTGGYAIAGRSAIWNESGDMVARAPESGECIVIAKADPAGWTGRVVAMNGSVV